jgi:DNA-binding response OmpR family regulator
MQDHVLLIEGSAEFMNLARAYLQANGFLVTSVNSGADGLRAAFGQRLSAILLDLALPDMDGFTFLGQLKGDPATHALPVLVVTAYSDPEYRVRSSEMGAAGFLSKPFSGGDLVAEVGRILNEARHP